MHFLLDGRLPPLLLDWLADRGHTAVHDIDLGLAQAEDEEVWTYAVRERCALLTKDVDFVGIRRRKTDGPAVCWWRIGYASSPFFLVWFEKVFPEVLAALERGESFIEAK